MVSPAVIEHEPARADAAVALAPRVRALTPLPRVAPARVHRPRLVRPLLAPDAPPVAVLVAPAGFGKTTVLLDWSERDARPFAWVALDARDNDARRLRASVRRAIATAVGRGAAAEPYVLVLDDVHVLHDPGALAAVAGIADDLPPEAMLAVASRTRPPLPIARLRALRAVTVLGPRELAMTRAETAALMDAEGHEVGRDGVAHLLAATEGWPAALSLASLFLAERGAADAGRFGGADRLVTEYVRDEVLAGLPAEQADFLLRTCVAETLTAPLCDALAGGDGAAVTLAALERHGLLVGLDRADERFRHHRVLSESLRALLRATGPEPERELHRRASAWHLRAGDVDRAIDHALRAGDVGAAADLVWQSLAPAVAAGGAGTVERRLARFLECEIAEHPSLALAAAGCALLRGQGQTAAHWAAVAAAAGGQHGSVHVGVALVRAALGGARTGLLLDASGAHSAGRALCSLIAGSARHLEGDADAAAAALEAGARAAAVSAPAIHALCLAELAVLALDERDGELAASLVTRARAQVDRHGLADHAAMALVLAVSALVRARRGRVDDARQDLDAALALQAQCVDLAPGAEAAVALVLARAALRLSDVHVGRAQLAGARRLLRRLPEAVTLHRWAVGVAAQLECLAAGAGASHPPMTAAELRILQYLPTHLTFREIGELTYVSGNTVKTQATAVYRKLGVTSRSDAVVFARDCGLLDSV